MGKRQQEKSDSGDMTTRKDFDLRLIPEFDGTAQPVSEWLEKTELVCELQGMVTGLQNVVPLRLKGGAFSVYQQLGAKQKQSYNDIKRALLSAFALDKFRAYDLFVERKLKSGEAVDVYLADLRRLASLFGGLSDEALGCAFIAGLPQGARQVMRSGASIEAMSLEELLNRARALLVDVETGSAAAAITGGADGGRFRQDSSANVVICYSCRQPNHMARDCLSRSNGRGQSLRGSGNKRCFRCSRRGHVASECPENGNGEADSAPVSSPGPQ